ncbi:hypothetical protein AB0B01_05170 [Streptomyces sp. NPDC044571]|uniref:hypothetical protein n=1 Tax=Streptomyces sp. NPDC044571 TaxID=3155371 RepID=UPI003406003F
MERTTEGRSGRRPGKGAAAAVAAVLLLVAGVPTVVDWTTGRPHRDPGCKRVAFMSMTGAEPACR